MSAEIVLGTAQLGSAYGINNAEGKPSKLEAFNVLDAAYNAGIRVIDTAEGYGDSESVIGTYQELRSRYFKICTKMSNSIKIDSPYFNADLHKKFASSLNKLGVDKVYIYYLHDFLMSKNRIVLDFLLAEKSKGSIEKIGVSIYEPNELEYIVNNIPDYIDVVQIPLNIFNCSQWIKEDLLSRAKDVKIDIAVRSIYLQGLVFMDPSDAFVKKLQLSDSLAALQKVAKEMNVSVAQACCDFIRDIDEVSLVLLGCETPKQVRDNVAMFNKETSWTKQMVEEQLAISVALDQGILDPRTWNKG